MLESWMCAKGKFAVSGYLLNLRSSVIEAPQPGVRVGLCGTALPRGTYLSNLSSHRRCLKVGIAVIHDSSCLHGLQVSKNYCIAV